MSESARQKAVEQYLRARGDVWFMRTNPGMRPTVKNGKEYRVREAPAGTADLLGCFKGGRFFGIEMKSETGKLRPSQVQWKKRIEELGGVVLSPCRSVLEAKRFLDDLKKGSKP